MRKFLVIFFLSWGIAWAVNHPSKLAEWLPADIIERLGIKPKASETETVANPHFVDQLNKAYEDHISDIIITGYGTVQKVLPDDTQGIRHQRFILNIANGPSLLVAHNIDLAPRINHLKKGQLIHFKGEYEWNSNGGVLHWTHHDPSGRHPNGWLKRDDLIFD